MSRFQSAGRTPVSEALRMLNQARTNYGKLELKQKQQLADYRDKIATLEGKYELLNAAEIASGRA